MLTSGIASRYVAIFCDVCGCVGVGVCGDALHSIDIIMKGGGDEIRCGCVEEMIGREGGREGRREGVSHLHVHYSLTFHIYYVPKSY